MRPILILQNCSADGPAYLQTWLEARGLPFEVRDAEAGDPFPAHLRDHAALAVLGGVMSANDDLPFLRQTERLILEAMAAGQPVIGHCLGGQLMARALGAPVSASPAPEIGWQPMELLDTAPARHWFGTPRSLRVMQWHYESFALPPGAQWLARSAACPHQAFAIGPHLAMQFHVEIDAPKLQRWLLEDDPLWERALASHASVQDQAAIRAEALACMSVHQLLADHVYTRWAEGLAG